jgi:hypothetical protein
MKNNAKMVPVISMHLFIDIFFSSYFLWQKYHFATQSIPYACLNNTKKVDKFCQMEYLLITGNISGLSPFGFLPSCRILIMVLSTNFT